MVDREKLTAYDTRHYPVRPQIGVGVMMVRNINEIPHLLLIKRKYNPDK